MKKAIVFRLIALSQMSYEAGCYVRDALKRRAGGSKKEAYVTMPDGTSLGGLQVTQGNTLSDLVPSCKELWHNSVLRGHVNPQLFSGVGGDSYPELHDRRVVADNRRLLQVAMRHAWRLAELGAKRTGCLPPYVASQLEHLTECQGCIDAVLHHVREGLRTRSAIDGLLERAGMLRRPSSLSS